MSTYTKVKKLLGDFCKKNNIKPTIEISRVLDLILVDEIKNPYLRLSKEAKEVARSMIEHCIDNCVCMGMDEGCTKNGKKRSFRVQLEKFVKQEV